MLRIRRGDTVQVIKGRDIDKKGRVIKIFYGRGRALVEGIHLVKKHLRRTRQDQQGGIVSIESPISLANLMFVCKHCNRSVRIGFMVNKDGTKDRFCRSCKEMV